MKKINYLILLLVLCVPFAVKADMGAPEFTEYAVVVTNPSGAACYNYDYVNNQTIYVKSNKVINYNEVIKIIDEKRFNEELYLTSYDSDCTVKSSDVKVYGNDVVTPNTYSTTDRYVYAFKDGGYMYKGPSLVYGKVSDDPIPAGTTLKVLGGDEIFDYVEYNGQRGWIYTYSYPAFDPYNTTTSFVTKYSKDVYFYVGTRELKLYDNPYADPTDSNSYIVKQYKLGEKIKVEYGTNTGAKYSKYGIMVDGKVRWIFDGLFAQEDTKLITGKKITYYQDMECKNVAGTMDEFVSLDFVAIDGHYYDDGSIQMQTIMVRYDNDYYFLKGEWENLLPIYEYRQCDYLFVLDKEGYPYYSDYDLKKEAGRIKNGEIVKLLGDNGDYETEDGEKYLVEIDGKKYHIGEKDKSKYNVVFYFSSSHSTSTYKYDHMLTMYTNYTDIDNLKDEVTIPANAELIDVGVIEKGYNYNNLSNLHLVKYNGQYGIVKIYKHYNYKYDPLTENVCFVDGTKLVLKEDKKEEPTSEVVITNNDDQSTDKSNNKYKTVAIVGTIVGISLAAVAIVIIVIVNKKKKNKTEEVAPVEEQPEAVMTENDLNLIKENVEPEVETKVEEATEEVVEEPAEVEETTEEPTEENNDEK